MFYAQSAIMVISGQSCKWCKSECIMQVNQCTWCKQVSELCRQVSVNDASKSVWIMQVNQCTWCKCTSVMQVFLHRFHCGHNSYNYPLSVWAHTCNRCPIYTMQLKIFYLLHDLIEVTIWIFQMTYINLFVSVAKYNLVYFPVRGTAECSNLFLL